MITKFLLDPDYMSGLITTNHIKVNNKQSQLLSQLLAIRLGKISLEFDKKNLKKRKRS